MFPVVRALQELRWLVRAARALELPAGLAAELAAAEEDLAARVAGSAAELRGTDVDAVRGRVNGPLTRAGAHARRSVPVPGTCAAPTWSARTCGVPTCAVPCCAGRSCSVPTCAGPTWGSPT